MAAGIVALDPAALERVAWNPICRADALALLFATSTAGPTCAASRPAECEWTLGQSLGIAIVMVAILE